MNAAEECDMCASWSSVVAGLPRASFRSVKEAVEAAQDGDQIILLPGIHNGLG